MARKQKPPCFYAAQHGIAGTANDESWGRAHTAHQKHRGFAPAYLALAVHSVHTARCRGKNRPKNPQNSAAGARRLRMPSARASGTKGMPKKAASGLCKSSSHKTRKGNREGITVSQHSCMPCAAPCMATPGRARVCAMHITKNRNHAVRGTAPFLPQRTHNATPFSIYMNDDG